MPDTEFFDSINDYADLTITEACGGWIVKAPDINQMDEEGASYRQHIFTDPLAVARFMLRVMRRLKSLRNEQDLGKNDIDSKIKQGRK